MIIVNYVLVLVFASIVTGFRIDLQNDEGKIKSPLYRAINRIRRSEDSTAEEGEDTGDDMEVAENRYHHFHGIHSFLPFPPPNQEQFPGKYPHFGHHQHMFGHSDWHNGNDYGQGGSGYNHHNHIHGSGHGYGHGHGYGPGHVHGYGCGHNLNNEFDPHGHHHGKNDISTSPSTIINPVDVTTPPTSSTSEIYDIDVRLGS